MPRYRATFLFASSTAAKVNRAEGTIKGVSIITVGEAKGHDCYADARTLSDVLSCAKTYKSGLRFMFNPETFAHGPAGIAGFVERDSMRIDGDQLLGDLRVHKSYAAYDYLFDIAESQPDTFGLSIEFSGPEEVIDGLAFARCSEIYAVTLVDRPAANKSGLFSVKEDSNSTASNPASEQTNNTEKPMTKEELAEIGKMISDGNNALEKNLSSKVDAATKPLAEKITKLEEAQKKAEEEAALGAPADEDELAAAGIEDSDTKEEKEEKLRAFRQEVRAMGVGGGAFTRRLFSLFRGVGNTPASTNREANTRNDNPEKSEDKSFFSTRVAPLVKGGAKESAAWKAAIASHGKEYSAAKIAKTVYPPAKSK